MRRPSTILPSVLLAATLGSVCPAGAHAQEPAPAAGQEAALDSLAMAWVGLLRRQQFDSAAAQVAPAVAEQFDSEALSSVWQQIATRFGSLESLEPGSRTAQDGYDIVDLAGTFENGSYTVRVVFDQERKVSGFFITQSGGASGA